MKKLLFITFYILSIITVVSCTDDEFQLTSKWQLREYKHADGGVTEVDSIFYNFQKGSFLAICMDEKATYHHFHGTYLLGKEELFITIYDTRDSYYNKFFGEWTDANRIFQIEELSSSKMRLNYEGTASVFRKY
jgi:hypothetical protein